MRTVAVLTALLVALPGLAGCADDPVGQPAPTVPTPSATSVPAPSATPTPTPTAASPSAETVVADVALTGDGIDLPGLLLEFGAPFPAAETALKKALGPPSTDTGVGPSFGAYGTCPGSQLRALEYGDGALVVLFGDVAGPELTMYQWSLTGRGTPATVPPARALVGDVTTYELVVGATVAELRAGTSGAELDVQPGDEVVAASFRLQDQSSGFFGFLTGSEDDSTITSVLGGDACGE